MRKYNEKVSDYRLGLSSMLCASIFGTALTGQVQALEFRKGNLVGNFNSQLSVGVSQRIENRDPELISTGNGGVGLSNTGDDGNLNFDKDDVFHSS